MIRNDFSFDRPDEEQIGGGGGKQQFPEYSAKEAKNERGGNESFVKKDALSCSIGTARRPSNEGREGVAK